MGGMEGDCPIYESKHDIPVYAASSHVVSQSQVIFPASAPYEENWSGRIKYELCLCG